MASRLGEHAVVIGGSIAGLVGARVLADYFDRVTILERDHIESQPAVHRSIPQGNHLHAILTGGLQVLSELYPGFGEKLHAMGAVPFRLTRDFAIYRPDGLAFSLTGTVKEPRDLGIQLYSQSRGLLEHCLRQCTLALSNISAECDAPVEHLIEAKGRVEGVSYKYHGEPRSLRCDLVLDCGGRGSRAPRWLTEMGFSAPEETTIGVDFAYSSTRFRIPNDDSTLAPVLFFVGPPPAYPRGGALAQIENGVWLASLAGRFGDYPPQDEAGFMAFAAALPTPKLYEILKDAERIDQISHFRFPASVLRHYERLPSFPERFLVLGDAISSFNPVYGQGMSSAVLQARALGRLLEERTNSPRGLEAMATEFFPRAAEVVNAPWTLAANFDFAFPQTTGTRSSIPSEIVRYFLALDALTAEDIEIHKTLVEVFGLARPLSALWDEPVRSRVLARMQRAENAG
ncbi:MAG: FAD-dependent monooxygenase [Deltaproteobacteria bacterium]|nr:FAD-dependent monooxygenase [Deltaproteobacteria bacterium]